jgi:TIR domain
MNTKPIRIFISYSHENEIWLTQYLDPLKNKKNPKYLLDFWELSLRGRGVVFWYDRDETQGIRGSDKWRARIFEEIDNADIAILLITQDFIISPFIRDEELPYILNRSKESKMEILPILLEPARLKDLDLANTFQITPGRPTPLSEILEASESKGQNARIEIIEAIEYVIEKVLKKRNPDKPQETDPQIKSLEEIDPIEVKIIEERKPIIGTILINNPSEIKDTPSVRLGEIKIISNSKEPEKINVLRIGDITIK